MSKTEKRVALVANAYLLERDALRVELDAMRQRAEAAEKDADAMRCLAYERTQRKDIAEAALAAERARAEIAQLRAALRASTEAAAVVYLRSEVDQLRDALAAATARAEAAEAAIDAMDDYLNYRDQSIAENCRPRSFIEWWRIRQMAQKVQP